MSSSKWQDRGYFRKYYGDKDVYEIEWAAQG